MVRMAAGSIFSKEPNTNSSLVRFLGAAVVAVDPTVFLGARVVVVVVVASVSVIFLEEREDENKDFFGAGDASKVLERRKPKSEMGRCLASSDVIDRPNRRIDGAAALARGSFSFEEEGRLALDRRVLRPSWPMVLLGAAGVVFSKLKVVSFIVADFDADNVWK